MQVGGDTAEELAQEDGFGARLLHLGLQYAQDILSKFTLALRRGAGEEAVVAALERSSVKDLLPCLESLTWGLLTGLEATPGAGGGAGAPPPSTPRAVTTATLQELEKVYNSVCDLVRVFLGQPGRGWMPSEGCANTREGMVLPAFTAGLASRKCSWGLRSPCVATLKYSG